MRDDLKDSVHGVVGARRRIHFFFHARFRACSTQRQDHFLFIGKCSDFIPGRVAVEIHAAYADDVGLR